MPWSASLQRTQLRNSPLQSRERLQQTRDQISSRPSLAKWPSTAEPQLFSAVHGHLRSRVSVIIRITWVGTGAYYLRNANIHNSQHLLSSECSRNFTSINPWNPPNEASAMISAFYRWQKEAPRAHVTRVKLWADMWQSQDLKPTSRAPGPGASLQQTASPNPLREWGDRAGVLTWCSQSNPGGRGGAQNLQGEDRSSSPQCI